MPGQPLTTREQEIADLLARGLTNIEIARELFVGEQTVKFHLTSMFVKMRCRNRAEVGLLRRQELDAAVIADLERQLAEVKAELVAEREALARFRAGLWSLCHVDTEALRELAFAAAESV